MRLYTIGYGGRLPAEVFSLLRPHGIKTVVDVRLRPERACMGVWQKARDPNKGILKTFRHAGIGYLSFVELGNPFVDLPDRRECYAELLASFGELLTRRLHTVEGTVCLLCAEKRPAECHRAQIAEQVARKHGMEIVHL